MTIKDRMAEVVALWNAGHKHVDIAAQLGMTANQSALALFYARQAGIETRKPHRKPSEYVPNTCAKCGKGMMVPLYNWRIGLGKFCSHACAQTDRYTDEQWANCFRLYLERKSTRGLSRDTGIGNEAIRVRLIREIIDGRLPNYRPAFAQPLHVPPLSAESFATLMERCRAPSVCRTTSHNHMVIAHPGGGDASSRPPASSICSASFPVLPCGGT